MHLLGITVKTIGEVLIAVMVLIVHARVKHEHRIDKKVLRSIGLEEFVGLLGVALIITGYIIQVLY